MKKLVHQFVTSRQKKVSTKIRQAPSELLRDYLTCFDEATIRVVPLNQEMFARAFQNGLKGGHFNEYLTQKPPRSLVEVVTRTECYIKGEESNIEKKVKDVKRVCS